MNDYFVMNLSTTIVIILATLIFAVVCIKRRDLIPWLVAYISVSLSEVFRLFSQALYDTFEIISILFSALSVIIFIIAVSHEYYQTFSTNYQKWISENRDLLLYQIAYTEAPHRRTAFWVPKFGHKIEWSILAKCLDIETTLSGFMRSTPHRIYYRTTGGLYWKVFTDFPPLFRINGVPSHSSRETSFSLAQAKIVKPVIAVLSSDIFWWWYTLTTNCRDLNPSDIQNFLMAHYVKPSNWAGGVS